MNPPCKTPVSFLQEFCMKRKIVPAYQDLHDGVPSNTPIFFCEVTCKEFRTRGQGRSKKEAKHAAAEKMLDILKNCPDINFDEETEKAPIRDDTTIPSPYENKLKENAVGPLTDYCAEFKLPPVCYKFVREEGPPHDKRFTERCDIKSFVVEATEKTKKQAKQVVAHQMITFLRNTIDPRAKMEVPTNFIEDSEDFQNALEKFPNCGTEYNTIIHPGDLSGAIIEDYTRYTEYHSSFKEYIDVFTDKVTENPEFKLSSLLEKTEMKYSLIPVPSKKADVRIVVFNIDFAPSLNVYGYGSSYVEASKNAAIKALQFIKILVTPCDERDDKEISHEEFETLIEASKSKLKGTVN